MRPQFLDLTNNASEEDDTPPAFKEAMITTKLAGRAVIRVVGRCNDAQENENLDLSECQLMQVPEAVFHLMRNTSLKTCDLSFNVITKIPPKLGSKFSCITELNLSNNRMSKLPDELCQLRQLRSLDVSFNSFLSFPTIAFTLPVLEKVNAQKNFIADVDAERLKNMPTLQLVNLMENPLSLRCLDFLATMTVVTILVTPRESTDDDDWADSTEDLNQDS